MRDEEFEELLESVREAARILEEIRKEVDELKAEARMRGWWIAEERKVT